MVGSGHCNITMICACCDLTIPLPFVSRSNFSHVVLTTAASVLCRTQAATLAARASTQSPAQAFQNAELCTSPRSILSVKNIYFLISYHGKWCIPSRFWSNVIGGHRAMSHVLAVAKIMCLRAKGMKGIQCTMWRTFCLCCVPPPSKWPLKG